VASAGSNSLLQRNARRFAAIRIAFFIAVDYTVARTRCWTLAVTEASRGVRPTPDGDRSHSRGAIVQVDDVGTEYGMFDEYRKYLDGPCQRLMEEVKNSELASDEVVFGANPLSSCDPANSPVMRYQNLAALDSMTEPMAVVDKKAFGSKDAANKGTVDREKVREVLGGELLRERCERTAAPLATSRHGCQLHHATDKPLRGPEHFAKRRPPSFADPL
jgi:hypothetical protein